VRTNPKPKHSVVCIKPESSIAQSDSDRQRPLNLLEALAYTKGALVFDMLSRELGRATFQDILHQITQSYRFQRLAWPEFLIAIERSAGRTLDWFYEQWNQHTGAPDFQLSWKQEGDTLRGTIARSEPYYVVRLKLQVQGETVSALQIVQITGASVGFAVSVSFRVHSVTLDPDFEILRWTPEYRAAADGVPSGRNPGQ